MLPVTALILADEPTVRSTELEMTERAALAARRAGIEHVHIVGDDLPSPRAVRRLRTYGMTVTCAPLDGRPFGSTPPSRRTVVLSASAHVDPAALARLVREATFEDDAQVVTDGSAPGGGVTVLSDRALAAVRSASSIVDALQQLAYATRSSNGRAA